MAESASSLPSQAVGRPPVKQRAIVDMLHRQIIQGVLAPGSKLPTRRDLVAQFGGSFLSVQQALDQLVGEGFVEARGPAGTFVSQRPPHLHDYALIFPQLPSHPGFRRFWTALSNEAERLNQVSGSSRHITAWYGIDGHADNEDFQRLVALVKRRQLAVVDFRQFAVSGCQHFAAGSAGDSARSDRRTAKRIRGYHDDQPGPSVVPESRYRVSGLARSPACGAYLGGGA